MNRHVTGKWLLTAVLAAGAALGFVLDWSPNHLLNPLWHPHAKFHGALLLFLLTGVSSLAIWLLWRDSKEPEAAVKIAAAIPAAFWTPFFYATALLPESTLWAGDPASIPRVAGFAFYPNVAVAGIFLVTTAVGFRLASHRPTGLTAASSDLLRADLL